MKRPAILLLGYMLTLAAVHAQALFVVPSVAEADAIQFNPAFIKSNSITSIVGKQMVKRDNEPMRPIGHSYYYRFDEKGRTVYSNNAFGQPGSGRDTASVTYMYNDSNQVIQRLRNDLGGHYMYTIDYDTENRPVQETYSRIENLGSDRYSIVPGVTTVISDEHYRYEVQSDTVTKKIFLNNLHLPYREQRIAKDQYGYLRSIDDVYIMSNKRARVTFRYNEKGRIAERIEQPDMAWPHTTKRTYKYDNIGNLVEARTFKNDVQQEQIEYLYEEGPLTLNARLTKDITTGQIHVVKYVTERR